MVPLSTASQQRRCTHKHQTDTQSDRTGRAGSWRQRGEIVERCRSFYRDPEGADELLQVLGLARKGSAIYKSLSDGQKQRLSIALVMIGWPRVPTGRSGASKIPLHG